MEQCNPRINKAGSDKSCIEQRALPPIGSVGTTGAKSPFIRLRRVERTGCKCSATLTSLYVSMVGQLRVRSSRNYIVHSLLCDWSSPERWLSGPRPEAKLTSTRGARQYIGLIYCERDSPVSLSRWILGTVRLTSSPNAFGRYPERRDAPTGHAAAYNDGESNGSQSTG